ncbi:MAG: hypothetical protein E7513_04315 [Ruminococcaceae bacterium]|nr:hypothetical protein [Oscillospiraceae bacterium]
MKETICTIPINDIFKDTNGCPICRMYELVEKQYVEYITGAAMMAPNIRVITNEKGFCHHHYEMMLSSGPKLSNALLMQTRLLYIKDNMLPKSDSAKPSKVQLEAIKNSRSSCYVCDRIDYDINHLLQTVYAQFATDPDFREMLKNQEFLCLNHYELLHRGAISKGGIKAKDMKAFCEVTNTLVKNYLDTLYDDVTHFTTMFDYRNAGGDWKNSKDSVERSVKFITSEKVEEIK